MTTRAEAPVARHGLGASLSASVAILCVNLVTGVLLARSLGPVDRGVLAAAVLWPTMLGVVGTLGLPEAVTYRVARDGAVRPVVLWTAAGAAALQAAGFLVLGAAVVVAVLAPHASASLGPALLFLGEIPLAIVSLTFAGMVNGRSRHAAFHALRLLVVGVTLPLLLALELAGALSVWTIVAVYLASRIVTAIAACRIAWPTGAARRPEFDRALARELWSYGLRSHASGISAHLNQRVDQLAVSAFLAADRLGTYVVAASLNSVGWLVGVSVGYVALPTLASTDDEQHRRELAEQFVGLTLLMTIAVALPLAVLAPTLISFLYGDAYREAGNIARILLAAVVLYSASRTIEAILRAVGRPLDAGLAEILALAATLVAVAALLPALGLIGAALASVVGAATGVTWMLRRVSLALDVPAWRVALPRPAAVRAALRRPSR